MNKTNKYRNQKGKISLACAGLSAVVLGACGATMATATDMPVTINVDSTGQSISLSSNTVSLNMNPGTVALQTGAVTVTVGSGNESGYRLQVSATDGTDLKMQGENATDDVIPTLPTLAEGYTDSTFQANYWGWRVGNSGNYFAFPDTTSSPLEIASSTSKTNGAETVFTFAAKADYHTVPGTYATTLNFQVTPYIVVPTIGMDDLEYMQDIATYSSSDIAAIVNNTPSGETFSLKDSRDETSYTIAKLADGKVWMTSNLNLTGGTKLDSTGSNVPSGYTQSNPYYTLPTSTAISSGTSVPNDQFSSDSGEYVFNTGNNTTTCNSSTPCNSYYSWLVATAGGKDANGSAVTGNGNDTAYSICPKGWKLPTSGNRDDSSATSTTGYKKGDFYKMLVAYGMNGDGYYANSGTTPTGSTIYSAISATPTPNFLLAGLYSSGSFNNGGPNGYYWSASSYSDTNAYSLSFNSGYAGSANYYVRRNGFSVRCLLSE